MSCLTRQLNSKYLSRDIVSLQALHRPHCSISNLGLDTETGPGVYETALAYTRALRMADNAILFKYAAKSIGMKFGIIPSFMAKPWGNVGIEIFTLLPYTNFMHIV